MSKSKKEKEGFIIVDEQAVPDEVRQEIIHYNNLLVGLISTSSSSTTLQALVVSENKIKKFLQKYPDLYPQKITFGPIDLIQLLQRRPIDVTGFMKELATMQEEYGEDYIRKILLFDSGNLFSKDYYDMGWSKTNQQHITLDSTQNNLFMVAVRTGNKELVEAMLKSIGDDELKKRILMQVMQYTSNGVLKFKSILELAIESNSADLLSYVFNSMIELGILETAASEMGKLASFESEPTNILLKALQQNNPDITATVLKNREKLGQILFVNRSETRIYPEYVVSDLSTMPAFVFPILSKDNRQFIAVFQRTKDQLNLDFEKGTYNTLSNNFSRLIGFSSVIKLGSYVANEDFDPVIFRRLLEHKITMHKQVSTLNALKFQNAMETGRPEPRSKEDTLDTLIIRTRLWEGSGSVMMEPTAAREYLEIPNVLTRLYEQAMKANNYSAGAVVLVEMFKENHTELMTSLINKADSRTKNIFLNYLLIEGVRTNNPGLIDFTTNFKFEIHRDIFTTLSKLPPEQMVQVAKELFHNLHQKKRPYKTEHLEHVLLTLASHSKEFTGSKKNVDALLKEIENNLPSARPNISFFASGPNTKVIRNMIHEIRSNPVLQLGPGQN